MCFVLSLCDYKYTKKMINAMRQTILFLLAAISITLSSCCDCRKSRALERPLVATTWQLIQIMGQDVTPTDDHFTLLFHNNGKVSGAGDCNRFTATYTTTKHRDLNIDNLGSTRRLCPNQQAENDYFAMLDGVTHYEMDADKMLLLSNGTLVGIMAAK